MLLSAKADTNAKIEDGKTALIYASEEGQTEVVKVLLSAGAEVNVENEDGKTALILASENGHTEVVILLEKYIALEKSRQPSPEERKIYSAFFDALAYNPKIKALFPKEITIKQINKLIKFKGTVEQYFDDMERILTGKAVIPLDNLEDYLLILNDLLGHIDVPEELRTYYLETLQFNKIRNVQKTCQRLAEKGTELDSLIKKANPEIRETSLFERAELINQQRNYIRRMICSFPPEGPEEED